MGGGAVDWRRPRSTQGGPVSCPEGTPVLDIGRVALERVEAALGERIAIAITDSAQQGRNPVYGKDLPMGNVLAIAIAVMDQPRVRLRVAEHDLVGKLDQLGAQVL